MNAQFCWWFCHSALVLLCCVRAGGALVTSQPTNGIYIGVCSSTFSATSTNWVADPRPASWADPLAMGIYSSAGAFTVFYPLDERYFARFWMYDTHGREVPRTPSGSRWGSRLKPSLQDQSQG